MTVVRRMDMQVGAEIETAYNAFLAACKDNIIKVQGSVPQNNNRSISHQMGEKRKREDSLLQRSPLGTVSSTGQTVKEPKKQKERERKEREEASQEKQNEEERERQEEKDQQKKKQEEREKTYQEKKKQEERERKEREEKYREKKEREEQERKEKARRDQEEKEREAKEREERERKETEEKERQKKEQEERERKEKERKAQERKEKEQMEEETDSRIVPVVSREEEMAIEEISIGECSRTRGRQMSKRRARESSSGSDSRSSSSDSSMSSSSSSSRSRCPELEATDDKLEAVRAAQEKRIMLNVGGRRFETSSVTLESVPSSLLSGLMKKTSCVKPYAVDGVYTYFIDRDPSHFRIILNYYRNQTRVIMESLPQEVKFLRELQDEAGYYDLPHLHLILEARIQELK